MRLGVSDGPTAVPQPHTPLESGLEGHAWAAHLGLLCRGWWGYLALRVTPSLHHRGLRGFREARRDFWRGAESLEAALVHNAEVPRRRAQEAEEAGAALKTARAGYQGRALDYALQVPAAPCPPPRLLGSQGLWPLEAGKAPRAWGRGAVFSRLT